MNYGPNRQKELNEARERDKRQEAQDTLKNYSTGKNQGLARENINTAKNLAKMATPWGLLSLAREASLSDIVYVIALLAAIFKDILDLISVTGIFYIIVVVMTFLTAIVIAAMMLLGSFGDGPGRAQKKIRSWLVLLSGTTVELLFGINFLPIETLTVLIIYGLALSARKEAKEKEVDVAKEELITEGTPPPLPNIPPPLPAEYPQKFTPPPLPNMPPPLPTKYQNNPPPLPNNPPSLPAEYPQKFTPPPLPNMPPPLPYKNRPVIPPPLPAEYRNTPPPLPNIPPPLPVEYPQKFTPPPLPNMPPSLPNIPPPVFKQLQDSHESISEEKELKHGSAEYYLQKSKIADKGEALQKFMEYVRVDSEEALKDKLKEKDENGDNVIKIDMFTPDNLKYLMDPSGELLRKIRDIGDALGYTYMNTPEYKSQVEDLVSKFRKGGRKEEALEAEEIFKELEKNFEKEKEKSEFKKIDGNLSRLPQEEEKFKKYIEEQKNLPPDAIVHLYHGLNSGGYKSALEILNGSSHGIEQHSGPTVSLVPVGQFWKGVGFRYALRRDQIEFPGENNPNAVVRMEGDDEYTGKIVTDSESLPLDKFEAEVMRSNFTLPNPDLEKKLVEKLHQFSEERNAEKN